jgi:hypothetical protein
VRAHPFYGACKEAELSLRYTTIGRNKDESITDRGISRYLNNGAFRREEKHMQKTTENARGAILGKSRGRMSH